MTVAIEASLMAEIYGIQDPKRTRDVQTTMSMKCVGANGHTVLRLTNL